MASKVLTITIGNDYTKISEVLYSSHKLVHVYFSKSIPTPQDCVEDGQIRDVPAVANAIKETIYNQGILTKDVIFSIQSNKIVSKEILIPHMKDNLIMGYINTNATEYFPVNIDEYVFTYSTLETVLDEDEKKIRMMVMAAPVGIVERYYDIAELLELNVKAVDYVGISTLQLVKMQVDEAPTLIILMGDDNTVISILEDKVLQMMRAVPYGRSTVANALMEKKEISYAEAMEKLSTERVLKESFTDNDYVTDSLKYLASNISRVMDYYTSKNPSTTIEKAILITEGKPIRAIETLFSYELGMKVNKLEELNRVIADPSLNMSLTELTVYLSNVGCILNPVNFVPRSALIKAKKGSDSRSTIFVLAGAFVIALAVVLVPLIQYLSKNSESKKLKSDIKRIEDITVVVDKYHTAKDKYDDVNAFMLYASDPNDDILKFINFLEEEMPSDISITNLSIASGEVTMVCKGNSKDTVAAFIVTLKNQSNISSVVCNTITESVDENDVATVTYTITCNFAKFPEKAAN